MDKATNMQADSHLGAANPFTKFKIEYLEGSISDCFQRQSQESSQRLAVKTRDRQLTYGELNREINRAAHVCLSLAWA